MRVTRQSGEVYNIFLVLLGDADSKNIGCGKGK